MKYEIEYNDLSKKTPHLPGELKTYENGTPLVEKHRSSYKFWKTMTCLPLAC